jgi:hypothetical protein
VNRSHFTLAERDAAEAYSVTILQIGCAKVIWFLKHYIQIMLHDKYAHVKFDALDDDGIQ